MTTPAETLRAINRLVAYLLETSLADDQSFAFQLTGSNGTVEVTFSESGYVSIALKNLAYREIYYQLVQDHAYNAKMLDGALIQMMYRFSNGTLQSHRLAFFPSPDLEEFQNNSDIYIEDEIYADVIARNIVPFPLRFDYNVQEGHIHPKSHLTLGQYEHCRIPVTGPLTPSRFIDFILRNFYHTAFNKYADSLPSPRDSFDKSIRPEEERIVHIMVPV